MNSKVLEIETETLKPLYFSSVPTLTEIIENQNRTQTPQSSWLRDAILKEVVSKHRHTVEEIAKLALIFNKHTPNLSSFEVKEKLTQSANILVQACLDEALPTIEHHLRVLLEKDLERQIDQILN